MKNLAVDILPQGMIQLKKDDIARASGTLAEAFFDYPLFAPAIPEKNRLRALSLMFEVELLYTLKKGAIYALDGELNEAAAWHFTMGNKWDILSFITCIHPRTLALLRLSGREGLTALGTTMTEVEKHLADMPLPQNTAYLSSIGIKPDFRGQHRMRRLLSPVLEQLESKGFSVCLYTNEAKNTLLYAQFGFKTVSTVKHGHLPCTSYFMLKSAPANEHK